MIPSPGNQPYSVGWLDPTRSDQIRYRIDGPGVSSRPKSAAHSSSHSSISRIYRSHDLFGYFQHKQQQQQQPQLQQRQQQLQAQLPQPQLQQRQQQLQPQLQQHIILVSCLMLNDYMYKE
jgi:hypothetical protein